MKLDEIDYAILEALQSDGRLSNVVLSNEVNLSESACLRRVKRLEQSGVIDRYVMLVNQAAVGKSGNVFVQFTLDRQKQEDLHEFEEAVRAVPEVMEHFSRVSMRTARSSFFTTRSGTNMPVPVIFALDVNPSAKMRTWTL